MAIQVVSFHCVLKNSFGHVVGVTFNRDVIVSNEKSDSKLKGLVEGLKNLKSGEKRNVALRADEAYGFYDPKLVIERQLDQLEIRIPLQLGNTVVYLQNGEEQYYRVTEISQNSVTLDANHPLAGQDLVFEIEATDTRDATPKDFEEAGETMQFSRMAVTH